MTFQRRKIKQHEDLLTDPRYRSMVERRRDLSTPPKYPKKELVDALEELEQEDSEVGKRTWQ